MQNSTSFLSHALIFSLLIILGITACDIYSDGGGDKEETPQTHIIDVLVEPDTVAPGDTASFTCIIEDSLDTRFKFYWAVDSGTALNGVVSDPDYPSIFTTNNNTIRWLSPEAEGFYSFEVTVNNGSEDSIGVRTSFSIVVEE